MNSTANKSAAENDLFDLETIAESFSAAPQKSSSGAEKYIVFSLGEDFYAVSSKQITEIIRPLDAAPLPNAPRWLSGIANLRGEIVPVIDLQKFLSNKIVADAPKSKFIVFRPAGSSAAIAFAVGSLNEIVGLSGEQIETVKDADAPYIFGQAVYKSNALLRLLDLENLSSSLSI